MWLWIPASRTKGNDIAADQPDLASRLPKVA
jgi:hypothetical protein